MADVLEKLRGGDRRSTGRAEAVAEDMLHDPSLFDDVFEGMSDDDPVVRMRAADAVERVTAERPDLLGDAHRDRLLGELADIDQQEVRWHVAQLLPRLELNGDDVDRAVDVLEAFTGADSQIVRVNAMTALANLAAANPRLRGTVHAHIEDLVDGGSPSVQARGRKLIDGLERLD